MIEEEYVSFETAKLAKGKGFEEPCKYFYAEVLDKAIKWECVGDIISTKKNEFLCPTQSLLARWLREKHNIHVCVGFCVIWRYVIIPITDKITADWSTSKKDYSTYDDAMEEGLKEALKLI